MENARILVVEDEVIVAMDVRDCLLACGFQVVDCLVSGEQALAAVAEAPPDLVLMDIRLEGEMDGIEAARRIREEHDVPSLFLTSYVDREMLDKAKGMDAVGYVLKPFEERELCIAVEMALHRWQVEKTLRQALRQASGDRQPAATIAAVAADAGGTELQVRVLGRLELVVNGRVLMRAEDLSRTLRSLLGLLVASQQLRIRQEDVQLVLWPESAPDKARSSFDSLLLRLRKTLDGLLAPLASRDYIVLQRGILCLRNCRVDAVDFKVAAHRGLEMAKRGKRAEAQDAFAIAFDLWGGPFALESSEVERLHQFHDELERLFLDVALSWSNLLADEGKCDKAHEILARAVSYDRTNDALVKALYANCLQRKNLARAADVLRQYEEALRRAGFSSLEIREALAGFATLAVT